jgi:hypothetical protein
MPDSGMLSAVGRPCVDPVMGGLSFRCSINAHELAVWIFGDDLAYFVAVDKQCLGGAPGPPELENARRVLALVFAYDHLPCGVVGIDLCGGRVDVGEGIGVASTQSDAGRGLRGTRRRDTIGTKRHVTEPSFANDLCPLPVNGR